jgi:hypothetical protein
VLRKRKHDFSAHDYFCLYSTKNETKGAKTVFSQDFGKMSVLEGTYIVPTPTLDTKMSLDEDLLTLGAM